MRHRQASAALLDADGFYATGDVVQQESPTRVVWVDRKKNVLKLAQGEFVSLGRLEADYKGNSSLIHQAWAGVRACLRGISLWIPPGCMLETAWLQ